MITPLSAAMALPLGPGRALLHSGNNLDETGRYSFLADRPVAVLKAHGTEAFEHRGEGWKEVGEPLAALERLCEEFDRGSTDGPMPFAMGYLGYELGVPGRRSGEPDLWMAFYDAVLRWDHVTGRRLALGENQIACERLEQLAGAEAKAPVLGPLSGDPELDARYRRGVERALEYIRAGDIYQANLARRLTAELAQPGDSVALYAQLAATHQVPYGAVLDLPGVSIVSASPERFLHRDRNGAVDTRPIKGTLREDAPPDELRDDPKQLAEHLMIVDLERNDLGRVAVPGTVAVEGFARTLSLSNVHHLVSTVKCQPRPEVSRAELLRATFPGGSITGAPKRRAMEIIRELEPVHRGVYTGAIGYFGHGGILDLSVAIRTAVLRPTRLELFVGGGVVADSSVDGEFVETEHKAAAWRRTLSPDREVELLSRQVR